MAKKMTCPEEEFCSVLEDHLWQLSAEMSAQTVEERNRETFSDRILAQIIASCPGLLFVLFGFGRRALQLLCGPP